MILTRREDWPARLHEAVEAARRTPFAWGRHDCLLFATAAVAAMTGVDMAAEIRGTYDDEAGALAALRAYAGGGMVEAVEKAASLHGLAQIPWQQAQRGDVVLVETVAGPALGICIGWVAAVAAIGAGSCGLGRVPMADVLRAWRIG